jgi:hypothetical protein
MNDLQRDWSKTPKKIALCQKIFFENEQNVSSVQIKIPGSLAQAEIGPAG